MSTRLPRYFGEDSSADLSEALSSRHLNDKTGGLTDCLDGWKHALVVTDIADLLRISERQVYKLVAAHRIPCFKIGGSIRFDPSAISAWLSQKMAPPCMEGFEQRRVRT